MIALEDQRALQPWLLPGERILWAGRPPLGPELEAADVYRLPFSLLWAGFALYWNVTAWQRNAPLFFTFWGLLFLALGLYFVAGRFIHGALLRSSLLYAVTNRRVIVLRTRFGRRLRSLELGYLPMLEYDEHPAGRGTLRFEIDESGSIFRPRGIEAWFPKDADTLCFRSIEQPRLVYDLIRREEDRRRVELFGERPEDRDFIG